MTLPPLITPARRAPLTLPHDGRQYPGPVLLALQVIACGAIGLGFIAAAIFLHNLTH